jgi:S1-C subfamily serine protease
MDNLFNIKQNPSTNFSQIDCCIMRLLFLILFIAFHFSANSQIINPQLNNDPIEGIYQIKLRECYNEKDILTYSSFFEGDIAIKSEGRIITAKKIKTGKQYFNIEKKGDGYKIIEQNDFYTQEGFCSVANFKEKEIKLKLFQTDFEHQGWYSIYTLQRITDDLYESISQGTGFFISTDGLILTNCHVIANSQKVNIYIADKEFECEVIYSNQIDDIAIIQVKKPIQEFLPICFSSNNLDVGEDVLALGFPLASSMGKELKMTTGIVNSMKGFKDDTRYFQFSAPIDPGNSGGPVLNKMGCLVGLTSSKHTTATNAGYALKLTNILKDIPSDIKILKVKAQTLSNSQIYSKYKKSIVLIKAFTL